MKAWVAKWGFFLLAGLILFVALTPTMRYYCQWDVGTIASVWVAIGTILLAAVTAASVYETRAVVLGEDKRFQIQYAPTVTIEELQISMGKVYLRLQNSGGGLASNIHLELRDILITSQFANQPQVEIPTELATYNLLAKGDSKSIAVFDMPYQYNLPSFRETVIRYADMFGNAYITSYPDYSHDKTDFYWTKPANLSLNQKAR